MYDIYSIEFLTWLNDWLYFRMREKKKDLIDKLKNFDISKYKNCNLYLYRISDFRLYSSERSLLQAVFTRKIDMDISSWSVDYNVVKEFFLNLLTKEEGFNYIVRYKPQKEDIILNINDLLSDINFKKYVSKNMHKVKKYKKGLFKYKNKQKEVILNVPSVPIYNIQELGYRMIKYKEYFNKQYPGSYDLLKRIPYEKRLRSHFVKENYFINNEIIKKLDTACYSILVKKMHVFDLNFSKQFSINNLLIEQNNKFKNFYNSSTIPIQY